MAKYINCDHQEVDAYQLSEDTDFNSGAVKGKKGQWFMKDIDGLNRLVEPNYFAANFTQKFPRMIDEPAIDTPLEVA